ncbi:MAG: extracellular solute-binding protein, partial [Herpetosiphonaceae bacterium]|nr:extracellular solute-binding protein [Herpetosiphonaceae bacterium]
MKSLRLFILLTVLSSLLLACGSEATTSTTQTGAAAPTAAATEAAAPTAAATEAAAPTAAATEAAMATEAPAAAGTLVIYSGRSESLVGPLLEMFEKDTGIKAEVRYGDTAELAAQLLEEGDNSPADVFFAQDAGALGALNDRFVTLDTATMGKVEPRFSSENSTWVGVSGRARVLVYNTDALKETDLPASILELTDPKWQGRIGWAPTNASFQAFVTALRISQGDDAAKAWLEGMLANDVQTFEKNGAIVQAVADGEIDAGLVNHYYLFALKKDKGEV